MGEKSRINKYIALCGVCSRRAAEELIRAGRVKVNGEVSRELGRPIDHDLDTVQVDGQTITPEPVKRYILLNKPPLTVTTVTDPHGRRTVIDCLRDSAHKLEKGVRVYPVGRLDFDTEGALLLTNDGELAHKLAHPRYQVEKVYEALVDGEFTDAHARTIAGGVTLEDGHRGNAVARALRTEGGRSLVELTLTEGHKREVKQLLAACGLETIKLTRTVFAGLTTEGLEPGQWRDLDTAELKSLRRLVAK